MGRTLFHLRTLSLVSWFSTEMEALVRPNWRDRSCNCRTRPSGFHKRNDPPRLSLPQEFSFFRQLNSVSSGSLNTNNRKTQPSFDTALQGIRLFSSNLCTDK